MKKGILIGMLVSLVTASSSLAQPQLLGGHATATWELFRDPSPTPYCGIWGDTALDPGMVFHQELDFTYAPCHSSWLFHASADSLSYRGSWWAENPSHPYWNWSWLETTLTVTLAFDQPMRILAVSSSDGVLAQDGHTVTVTDGAGAVTTLVADAINTAAELDVSAGVYTVSLHVDLLEFSTHYPYAGSLQVSWAPQGGVATRRLAWDSLKARFHGPPD